MPCCCFPFLLRSKSHSVSKFFLNLFSELQSYSTTVKTHLQQQKIFVIIILDIFRIVQKIEL